MEEVMSRTLVNIPDDLLHELTVIAKKQDISRTELIQRILAGQLEALKAALHELQAPEAELDLAKAAQAAIQMQTNLLVGLLASLGPETDALDAAFGLWKDRTVDGVEYQRRLRDEW
jgi:hypothetical protein